MRRVTLTFDNGPTPGITDAVLDVLGQYDILATFFVIGQRLDQQGAALVRAAHAAGHWIGNHTLSHTVALGDRPDLAYAVEEIEGAQARLTGVSGPERLFRPYGNDGLIGPHLLSRAALGHLLGGRYTTVLWTSVPQDWRDPDGWVERCLADVAAQDWSVVVLHDIAGACLARLPELLGRLTDAGVRFEQTFPEQVIVTRAGDPVSLDPSYIAD